MQNIEIRGARTHNLKNISLSLPRESLIVITGLSGSGKSSLAFDTLYAEGQRRYVESLSAYARQFLSLMEKPEVDLIEGLSPAIAIEQKSTSHNPRSTVGTVTEIYDYLRLLFARVGDPRCPEHGSGLAAQNVSQMVDAVMARAEDLRFLLLSPLVAGKKGEHQGVFREVRQKGYLRVRVDGHIYDLDQLPTLDKNKKHDIDVVVDRLKIKAGIERRLSDSFEAALLLSSGRATVLFQESGEELHFSQNFACPLCGYTLAELEPRLFSFNNPIGACASCDGLGVKQYFDEHKVVHHPEISLAGGAIRGWDKRNVHYFELIQSLADHYSFSVDTPFGELPKKIQQVILHGSGNEKLPLSAYGEKGRKLKVFEGILPNMERRYLETESLALREELVKYLTHKTCEACLGSRLTLGARHVFIQDRAISEMTAWSIEETLGFFKKLKFTGQKAEIAKRILKEIQDRLSFLMDVGLEYLTLDRAAETLSGGEAQRIRLASQIGSGLVGVMYVLDEPSIGLHQRDNERLLKTLRHLRDLGNTVIVVEHDEEAILMADYVVDIGPGAGVHGGSVVAEGKPAAVMKNPRSLTGQYLSGKKKIEIPQKRSVPDPEKVLSIRGASANNLRNVSVDIPVGLFTCVTGVSGSGKSSLINDTLYPALANRLNREPVSETAPYDAIEGLYHFDKAIAIDQSPIGRTPRSNPATYTGMFTFIRELFSGTTEAKARGYEPGRFSFNVKGGRCEACEGDGLLKVEMHFLADVYVVCDACQGKRYNRETLEVLYKGKNIHEVLEMTIEEAHEFFSAIPPIARKLKTLVDVGLTYVKLGQSATTLSGGEAQRVKLSRELSKRDTGRTLYILDEPTTGLHFHDIDQLLKVLYRFRDHGNTVLVIEHNLDVIKTADWIIDMGPEGGDKGGQVVCAGSPETIAKCAKSHTGRFLKGILAKRA